MGSMVVWGHCLRLQIPQAKPQELLQCVLPFQHYQKICPHLMKHFYVVAAIKSNFQELEWGKPSYLAVRGGSYNTVMVQSRFQRENQSRLLRERLSLNHKIKKNKMRVCPQTTCIKKGSGLKAFAPLRKYVKHPCLCKDSKRMYMWGKWAWRLGIWCLPDTRQNHSSSVMSNVVQLKSPQRSGLGGMKR